MIFLYQLARVTDQDSTVGGVHFRPDLLVGVMAPSLEELGNIGIFVDVIPDPTPNTGTPKLHVNPETKELWYTYTPLPETEMDRMKKRIAATEDAILALMDMNTL